ncbi:arginase family protein [Pelagovum pacificum]|uniref:Arginase n=1 Tax=Pelagovum pacificum TaxID=2588711 RepID=A0A5C5GB17_9RHOB|nr:arginase family protein [Pelagovum pacificum]QQA41248.1 arginase family protein [Pelagovum pacificum]TNY31943.1 arginase [Pelagovum pacificum]
MSDLGRMFGSDGGRGTFLGVEAGPAKSGHKVALFGADTATPYASVGPYCAGGAEAIRAGSAGYVANRAHVNFDTGGVTLGDGVLVDCGNVSTGDDAAANRAAITAQAKEILQAGAVPVCLGGDDSLPIPMGEALSGRDIWVVQVDAHIDWRDEVDGERFGLSSGLRRLSEMGHVSGITQIGQRGTGSARPSDTRDARDWGATLVPARDWCRGGGREALDRIPEGADVLLCFDFDSLDPSIMPAVIAPTAGGLSYWDAVEIVERITARARIAAITMAEFMPENDRTGQAAILGAQLLTTWIGLMTADG